MQNSHEFNWVKGKKTNNMENGNKYTCKRPPTYRWQQTHPEVKEKKKEKYIKIRCFHLYAKGKKPSISSIFNDNIVLSLLCMFCAMFLKIWSLYFILLLTIVNTGQKNINSFTFLFIKTSTGNSYKTLLLLWLTRKTIISVFQCEDVFCAISI